LFLRHQTMDKVQKHNSFNTNTPSSESYRNHLWNVKLCRTVSVCRSAGLLHDRLPGGTEETNGLQVLVETLFLACGMECPPCRLVYTPIHDIPGSNLGRVIAHPHYFSWSSLSRSFTPRSL